MRYRFIFNNTLGLSSFQNEAFLTSLELPYILPTPMNSEMELVPLNYWRWKYYVSQKH
jgi:hypothetical protein